MAVVDDPHEKEGASLKEDTPLKKAVEQMHVSGSDEDTATGGEWGDGASETNVTTTDTAGAEWGSGGR